MGDGEVENNCHFKKNLETVESPSAVEEVLELLVLYPTPYRPGMRLTSMKHKSSIIYVRHDQLNYRDWVSWRQPDLSRSWQNINASTSLKTSNLGR